MTPLTNRRVLLVDDTPAIHEDFHKLLAVGASADGLQDVEAALFGTAARPAFAGFELESAHQGEEACARVAMALSEARPFAMAFVDMRMPPGWDGARTVEELWKLDPRLQIVICTAYSDHPWNELLERLNPGDRLLVLKKPFDGIEVRQLAEALTSKWAMTLQASTKIDDLEQAVLLRTSEIAESEARYRQLFDDGPLPMWVYDLSSLEFLAVNRAAVVHYGYTREQFLAMTIKDIRPPEDVPKLLHELEALGEAELATGYWRHRLADQRVIEVDIRAQPMDFLGRRARLVLALDVTARLQAEQRVRRLNRMVAVSSAINALIARVDDRLALFDAVCRVAVTEGGFAQAWIGLAGTEVDALQPVSASGESEPDRELLRAAMAHVSGDPAAPINQALSARVPAVCPDMAGPDCRCSLALREHSAGVGCRSLAMMPLTLAGVAIAVLVLYAHEADYFDTDELQLLTELGSDISFTLEHLDKKAQLNYLAYYDALTGLPNRTLFSDRLSQALAAPLAPGMSRALLLVDLRRFRHVNALGRHVGDALLRAVADRLTLALSSSDTLARVGGDCFAIALAEPQNSASMAHMIESTLLQGFVTPFPVDGQDYRVAVHVGVAMCPSDGSEAEILYKNAEAALRRAKHSADPFVFYASEMNAQVTNALSMENKLRAAIEADEFVLHYQPQVSAIDGQLLGFEALVRWQTPDLGLLLPGSFIAMAEDLGLIVELGRFVLQQACRQLRAWLDAGHPPCVIAVNVSAVQLHRPGFVAEVRDDIERSGAPAHLLELEITESAIMENIERMAEVLDELKAIGVTVALDDFGVGYSSLSRLQRLPIDKLKIDQSFVSELAEDSDDAAIVSAIIALAHQLHKTVIAEGVETEAQLRYLQANGCDQCQGHLFGMPRPIDVAESMLGQHLLPHLWLPKPVG